MSAEHTILCQRSASLREEEFQLLGEFIKIAVSHNSETIDSLVRDYDPAIARLSVEIENLAIIMQNLMAGEQQEHIQDVKVLREVVRIQAALLELRRQYIAAFADAADAHTRRN